METSLTIEKCINRTINVQVGVTSARNRMTHTQIFLSQTEKLMAIATINTLSDVVVNKSVIIFQSFNVKYSTLYENRRTSC